MHGAEEAADVNRTERHDHVVGLGRGDRRQVEHPPPLQEGRIGHLVRDHHGQQPGRVVGTIPERSQQPLAFADPNWGVVMRSAVGEFDGNVVSSIGDEARSVPAVFRTCGVPPRPSLNLSWDSDA
jgi:hypothetical protein